MTDIADQIEQIDQVVESRRSSGEPQPEPSLSLSLRRSSRPEWQRQFAGPTRCTARCATRRRSLRRRRRSAPSTSGVAGVRAVRSRPIRGARSRRRSTRRRSSRSPRSRSATPPRGAVGVRALQRDRPGSRRPALPVLAASRLLGCRGVESGAAARAVARSRVAAAQPGVTAGSRVHASADERAHAEHRVADDPELGSVDAARRRVPRAAAERCLGAGAELDRHRLAGRGRARLYDIYLILHGRDARARAGQQQPQPAPAPTAQTETANTADNATARDENGRFVSDPGRRQGRLANIEGLD
jgi:hypothetical protein